MTVTLELKPNLVAVAKAEAQMRGVAVENYLQGILEEALPQTVEQEREAIRRKRMVVLERLNGKYAGLPGGSDEFAAEKENEKAHEERFWQHKS